MNKIPKKARESFDLYYDDDKGIFIIDYYKNESLPLNGWLKPCINCYSITSNYIIFNYNDREIEISLCRLCNKNKYKNYKRINFLMDKIEENEEINKFCESCLC